VFRQHYTPAILNTECSLYKKTTTVLMERIVPKSMDVSSYIFIA